MFHAVHTHIQSVPSGTIVTESEMFVPSRRVRAPPGGKHTDIFSHESEDDALSKAPPRPIEQV